MIDFEFDGVEDLGHFLRLIDDDGLGAGVLCKKAVRVRYRCVFYALLVEGEVRGAFKFCPDDLASQIALARLPCALNRDDGKKFQLFDQFRKNEA